MMADHIDRAIARKRHRYGITDLQLLSIYDAQHGQCPVCCSPLVFDGRGGAHVDHNHFTGRVRGILCAECNKALGHYEKNAAAFAAYLDNPTCDLGLHIEHRRAPNAPRPRGRKKVELTPEEADAKKAERAAKKLKAQQLRRAKMAVK